MEGKIFYCYEFGEFRLDVRRRALSKNGEKVPLTSRNFDLLVFMVENGGRILEHEELLDKVWAGTFVEQATLKKGISALRHLLDEKTGDEYIQTIPRRGYSFVSPVRVVPENAEVMYVRETESEIIVEEFEETGDEQGENVIDISAEEVKALPSADRKKVGFARSAFYGAAGLAILTLAFLGLKPYFVKSAAPQFSVENIRASRLTNSGKILGGASISPDGNYLVYSSTDKEGDSLWLRQISSNNTIRLTAPVHGSFWGYVISPDNNYIYYILNVFDEPQKSGLFKVSLLGGEPKRIQENVSSLTLSPDGKKIGLVRLSNQTTIFTINSDGDDEHAVTDLPEDLRLLGITWNPEGTALLCTLRRQTGDKAVFYASEINSENGKETIVLPPQEKVFTGAVWLPDKSAILLTLREPNADFRQIWQFIPASQEWRRVTNDNNSYKTISLTRDGKSIVTLQESRVVSIWETDNLTLNKKTPKEKSPVNSPDNFRQITDGVNNYDQLGWLNDNLLMYSVTDNGKELIFTINADGTNPRPITKGDDGIWLFPNVTGDRQNVSFISSRSGIDQVWRVDTEGKNLTRMTQTTTPAINGRILRDNTTVLYTITQSKGDFLYKQTADGQIVQLTMSDTGAFAVSPDEKLVAAEILDEKNGKFHVELLSLTDGKMIKSFNFVSARQMIFTPDGNNLAYDTIFGQLKQIILQPLDGSEPYAITDFQAEDIFSFDISPDGKHLAVIRGNQLNDAVLIKPGDH